MIRSLLKKQIFNICNTNFYLNLKKNHIKKKKYLTILNLHKVSPKSNSAYTSISPKIFEELLIYIKKNFNIISFANINEKSTKPKLILSFDDGYKDFIEYTVPILRKYDVIVNQNIIPNCINNKKPPLNVLTQDFIGQSPISLLKEFNLPGLNFSENEIENRIKFGTKVSSFIKNRPIKDQIILEKYLLNQFSRFDNFKPTPMMTLEDIQSLIKEHEFGAHSFMHSSMKYESNNYFKKDLELCKNYFNTNFNFHPNIYAFPNGSYNNFQLDYASNSSYKFLLLVGNKFNKTYSNNESSYLFHRFEFDAQTFQEGIFKINGGLKL